MKNRIIPLLALILLLALPVAMAAEAPAVIHAEFEDGAMQGRARAVSTWVEFLTADGDSVTVTVEVPEGAFYDITVMQAGIGGAKENDLLVDGVNVGSTRAESTAYAPHTVGHVWLDAGSHSITVRKNWGYVRLDWLELTPSPEMKDPYAVEPVLCNPNAGEGARAVMAWLCENYGEKMVSGQFLDEYRYGGEIAAIAGVTGGLKPALLGLDMMNYSPVGRSLGSNPIAVDQAIDYWNEGYLITFCWHWRTPEPYVDTTGTDWWGAFYTEKTSFSLAKAMNGEDPEGYELLLRDMDAIAEELKKLRDAGVVVLWRPLHEASGGWFWWGASGSEPYIQLYRLMYDRYTNLHGLDNLIWVWNGQSADWYPGDDVVDIIGEDVYPGKHAHDSQSAAFYRCTKYTDAAKLIILSENGCVPSPEKCAKDGTLWGAWCTWCYEFVLDDRGQYSEEYTDAERLKLFYTHERTLTLADVPTFGRTLPEAASQEEAAESALTAEFEDGALFGNARLASVGGEKGVELWGNDEGDMVTVTVTVPADGVYDIVIRAAGIGGNKDNYLLVDGGQVGVTSVQGEAVEDCVTPGIELTAGAHEITVAAFWGWVRLDRLTLVPAGDDSAPIRVEFEDGELLGNVKIGRLAGEAWVELSSNDDTDGVTVSFSVPEAGLYDLTILQAGIGGYKENFLFVDGQQLDNTIVQGTAAEACVTPGVRLEAGEHTVTVTCFWGWTKLDALLVSPSADIPESTEAGESAES